MSPQNLVMAWRDHYIELVSAFENHLKRSTLVDCTLAAEGQFLKAHKVVLSACSPYFELLFSEIGEKHPIVILKDITFQDLKTIVNFMYKGEVEIHEDRLSTLLKVAETLQIKGLGDAQDTNESNRIVPATSPASGNTAINSRNCLRKYPAGTNVPAQDADESTWVSTRNSHFSDDKLSPQLYGGQSSVHANTTVSPLSLVSSPFPLMPEMKSEPGNPENSGCSLPVVPCFSSIENLPSGTETVKAPAYGLDADSVNDSEEVLEDMEFVDADHWVEEISENVNIEQDTQEYIDITPPGLVTEDHSSRCLVATETEDHATLEDLPSSFIKAENPASDSEVALENGDDFTSKGAADVTEEYEASAKRHTQFSVQMETSLLIAAEIPGNTTSNAGMRPVGTLDFESPEKPFATRPPAAVSTNMQTRIEAKRFKCSYCKYACKGRARLNRHARTHTGERPYKCGECDYASSEKGHLIRHMRIHTGERPYKCGECDYAFSEKGNLITHKRIHTGERPYKCVECDYATSQKSSLIKHKRTHTGERPYKYVECEYATSQKSRLIRNKRIHNGERPH